MTLLFSIVFQNGEYYGNDNSLTEWLTIGISSLALMVTFIFSGLGIRYQVISLLRRDLSELAKSCNECIIPKTEALDESDASISKLVSNLISAKNLIEMQYSGWRRIFRYYEQKQIDNFYCLLHTSVTEFMRDKSRVKKRITEAINLKEDLDGWHHRFLQIEVCSEWLNSSIQEYGSATSKTILNKQEDFKKKSLDDKKIILSEKIENYFPSKQS